MTQRASAPLESEIQADIRLALARVPGVCLFRNKTGVARHGFGSQERVVKYGLVKGGSDLVGIVTTADPPHTGRFIALEVKRPGEHPTPEQIQFLNLIRRFNGFATVVDSVDSALSAIARARAGEHE